MNGIVRDSKRAHTHGLFCFCISIDTIIPWIRGPSPIGIESVLASSLLGFDSPSVHSQEPSVWAVFVFFAPDSCNMFFVSNFIITHLLYINRSTKHWYGRCM